MSDVSLRAPRDAFGRIARFEPTALQREQVRSLAGIGCTNDEIRAVVPWGRQKPIDEKTLMKHFADEITAGKSIAKSRAKRALYEMAVNERSLGALIFYLKTQCGWKETNIVEAVGPGGEPLTIPAVSIYLPVKIQLPALKDRLTSDPWVKLKPPS